MKFYLNATSGNSIEPVFGKTEPQQIGSMCSAKKLPVFLQEMIKKIGECSREEESNALLRHLTTVDDNFQQLDTLLYKYKDYNVQSFFSFYGEPRVSNLEALNKAEIGITPELIDVAQKENTMYLITRIAGTEDGELIPFIKGCHLLSDQAKIDAYRDIQKMLKSGIDNVAMNKSTESWYITPKNPRIVIPDWGHVRQLDKTDNTQDLLTLYRNRIFRK